MRGHAHQKFERAIQVGSPAFRLEEQDFTNHAEAVAQRERPLCHQLRQRAAVDVFHDEIVRTFVLVGVERLDDVGVRELGSNASRNRSGRWRACESTVLSASRGGAAAWVDEPVGAH